MMFNCWDSKAEKRPNFHTILKKMENVNDKLASPQTTPTSRKSTRENQLSTVDKVTSRDNPVPVSFESQCKSSGQSGHAWPSPTTSPHKHVSAAGSSHLSLTFSVLSDDSGSRSSISDNEEQSPLAESVVFQMLPSLLKEGHKQERQTASVKGLHSDSPLNLVSSLPEGRSSKYPRIPITFIPPPPPPPRTPSTATTRLTPSETTSSYTSSQFGPGSTRRSDSSKHTQPLPTASPSPDLTSKSSMFGEEANPPFNHTPLSNADTVSKTPTADYSGTLASRNHNLDTSLQVHLNGNACGFGQGLHANTEVPRTSTMYPVTENPPTSIKTSGEFGFSRGRTNGLVNGQ